MGDELEGMGNFVSVLVAEISRSAFQSLIHNTIGTGNLAVFLVAVFFGALTAVWALSDHTRKHAQRFAVLGLMLGMLLVGWLVNGGKGLAAGVSVPRVFHRMFHRSSVLCSLRRAAARARGKPGRPLLSKKATSEARQSKSSRARRRGRGGDRGSARRGQEACRFAIGRALTHPKARGLADAASEWDTVSP